MDGSAATEVVDNSQREKWHGTMPVIYNVYGKPAWIIRLLMMEAWYVHIQLYMLLMQKYLRQVLRRKSA